METLQIDPDPTQRDPRGEMAARLPAWLQPALTWLTAKPLPGDEVRKAKPLGFVCNAVALVLFGAACSAAGLRLSWQAAAALVPLGLLLTTSGLGLFQVVIFHHCAHGTVFRTREANVTAGRLVSSILLFKHFDDYKREHMLHHSPNKLLTEEDEFADFVFNMCGLRAGTPKAELWRKVVVSLVSPIFHGKFLLRRIKAAWFSADPRHNAVGAGVWAGLIGVALISGQGLAFAVAWILPVTVLLQIATVFRILCEHCFPEQEIIAARGKDFVAQATSGVFPGAMPPARSAATVAGFAQWGLWWANMLAIQLPVRVFVLVGDAPCHDFHHRKPASKNWTSYIQARQIDLNKQAAAARAPYYDTWGLFRAVDASLASLSRQPKGAVF